MLVRNRSLVVISRPVLPQQITEGQADSEHTHLTRRRVICGRKQPRLSHHTLAFTSPNPPPPKQTSAQVGGKQKSGLVYYSGRE